MNMRIGNKAQVRKVHTSTLKLGEVVHLALVHKCTSMQGAHFTLDTLKPLIFLLDFDDVFFSQLIEAP